MNYVIIVRLACAQQHESSWPRPRGVWLRPNGRDGAGKANGGSLGDSGRGQGWESVKGGFVLISVFQVPERRGYAGSARMSLAKEGE